MRKFIISAIVAIVAAVSFAAPSQAGNYGYSHKSYGWKSYGWKSHGHGHSYGYKKHRHVKRHHGHHWGGHWGGRVIYKKKYYGYY